MINGLRPYPEMKPTGLPWVPEIPAHWKVGQLKHVTTSIEQGWSPQCDSQQATEGEWGVLKVGCVNSGRLAEHQNKKLPRTLEPRINLEVRDGDILVSRANTRELVGLAAAVHHPRSKLLLCDKLFRFRALKDHSDPNYLTYGIRLPSSRAQIESQTNGASDSMQNIGQRVVRDLYLPVAPIEEQRLIVRVLDWHGAQVAKLIRAKKKLIALLYEQKQAVIYQAVTRGLDPTAKLKPSGVPWLGDIPSHWKVRRNGRLFGARRETGFPHLPVLEVSIRSGVRSRDFDTGTRKQEMTDRAKYQRAVCGDMAYNMMRMWQGAVGIAPTDGLVSPAYVVARPLSEVCAPYYAYLFRTPAYMREIDTFSRGIVPDRNRLYWESFKQMPSICPPFEEQKGIARALDTQSAWFERAISLIEEQIAGLQEFRARLIADVVTGRLDVRAVAASLPEIAEAEPVYEIADDEDLEETGDAETEEAAA
jgi:type I restriction enzyme S subunit